MVLVGTAVVTAVVIAVVRVPIVSDTGRTDGRRRSVVQGGPSFFHGRRSCFCLGGAVTVATVVVVFVLFDLHRHQSERQGAEVLVWTPTHSATTRSIVVVVVAAARWSISGRSNPTTTTIDTENSSRFVPAGVVSSSSKVGMVVVGSWTLECHLRRCRQRWAP